MAVFQNRYANPLLELRGALAASPVAMLAQLFRRKPSIRHPNAGVPDGQRVYAIGDIHGRADLLDQLLDAISRDNSQRGACETHIVFLGDLIDRGPDSAKVVERARQMEGGPWLCRYLMGNHEEVFLKALAGDLKALAFFCRIGGRETILSYGVTELEYRDAAYPELLELMSTRVPAAHIEFLERFEDMILIGDYAFVHAGVRPGQPLASQRISDLRWIRHEFLEHQGGFEKVIVHGHTISDEVELYSHRIGLDTGAYSSGKLTAMGFENNRRWVLEARA